MTHYFRLEESPYYPGKYVIALNHDKLPFQKGFVGSFSVLPARLLGLSYATYLRYCRDRLGADLRGKGSMYVIPYFNRSEELMQLIKLLDKRAELYVNG